MKKTAQQLCDFYSPNRFDKTAGVISGLFNGVKKYLKNVPNYIAELEKPTVSGGFLNDIGQGVKSFLNPSNYAEAFKHGPATFVDDLEKNVFNKQVWQNAWNEGPTGVAKQLGTTAMSTLFPYLAISGALMDSPMKDMEGTIEKNTRRLMDFTDVMDLSGKIMLRNATTLPGIAGMIATRAFLVPKVTKTLDDMLGTNVKPMELRQKFYSRVNNNIGELAKKNPGADINSLIQLGMQQTADDAFWVPDYYKTLIS